jgi:hypothetical protein
MIDAMTRDVATLEPLLLQAGQARSNHRPSSFRFKFQFF